jgi:hypothetical protein
MRTRSFAGSSVPAEEDWEKVEGIVNKRIEEANAQPSSNLNGFRMVALLPHFGGFDVPTLEEVAIRFFMASEPTTNNALPRATGPYLGTVSELREVFVIG